MKHKKEHIQWVVCSRRTKSEGCKKCSFAESFQVTGEETSYSFGTCTYTEEKIICVRVPSPKKQNEV